MLRRRIFHIVLPAVAFFAFPRAASAQLVNGSFESCPSYANLPGGSSAISGWTTTHEGVEWFAQSAQYVAYSGSCMLDLAVYVSNGNPGGGIAQSLALKAGSSYEVSFAAATLRSFGRDGTGVVELWLNGVFANAFAVSNSSPDLTIGDWKSFTYDFVADGTTSIEFRNRENAFQHFAYLDGVSVAAVVTTPEPASLIMLATGLMGLCCVRRSVRTK